MLSLEAHVEIGRERYQDFVREAEHERLVNALPAAQPSYAQAVRTISRWLDAQRSRVQFQTTPQSCCTPALCC
jgi:hypothetical protein